MENIVVIGGGITGLSTAYHLNKEIKEKGLPIKVILIERSSRLGGKMQTCYQSGFVIERGPDCWLASKTAMSDLAREVGLGDSLVYNQPTPPSYICVKNKLHHLPEGATSGIPTEMLPFATTGLISPLGKLRAGLDLLSSRTEDEGDVALGPFFRKHFGDELVTNLVDPLLSGIYAGNLETMSAMATFPSMLKMEHEYGSLMIGMKKSRKKMLAAKAKMGSTSQAKEKPKGFFMSMNTGVESLIPAIEKAMPEVEILKEHQVIEVSKAETGYTIMASNGQCVPAGAIVVATEHQALPQIFQQYDFLQFYQDIPSTSVVNVTLAYRKEAVKKDLPGSSFLVAKNSDYNISACAWQHHKWPHMAPEGFVLLRAHMSKLKEPEVFMGKSDEDIVKTTMIDINKHIHFEGDPVFTVVNRWKKAMPQYMVGHLERLKEMREKAATELPGVFFSGASHDGIGMPDCIACGKSAAETTLKFLNKKLVKM